MRLCSADGAEFARALINYSSEEVDAAKVYMCVCLCVGLLLSCLAWPRLASSSQAAWALLPRRPLSREPVRVS